LIRKRKGEWKRGPSKSWRVVGTKAAVREVCRARTTPNKREENIRVRLGQSQKNRGGKTSVPSTCSGREERRTKHVKKPASP